MTIQLLTLICLAGAAFAGPFQREAGRQCSSSCPAANDPKFNYHPGSQYNYRYKGIDYVSAAGSRKQQKSELTANVEIHVLERCEMTLQLNDIQYQGEQPLAQELVEQLSVPLHFSWVDGNIENICSSSEESQESENIKRGILSAIVNTIPDFRAPSQHRELDSLGFCETKYTIVRNSASSITIRKEKSLKSCDNRHSGLASFPYNPYQSPESKIQALPVFTHERSECQQLIQNEVIKQVVCKARAQIQPLSEHDSLVEFQGEIQLELQNVQRSSMPIQRSQMEKKSIRYSYVQEQDVEAKEQEANKILTELCPKSQGLLHPSVSKLFVQLVMALKSLPAENVQRIYQSLKNQQLCSSPKTLNIFLDALPMTGTEGAIKLMVELLQTQQVSGLKAKSWPVSFALIPHPSAESISAALPLISGEEKNRSALLGLSAMISKVCSNNDCDQIESVQRAVSTLQQALGPQCSKDNETEVISILKTFGNMGYHGQAEKTILTCAESKENSINVRLAAIDSFRRYSKKIPSALLDLYSTPNEHYELRIAALATAIQNADEEVAEAIQNILSNDQDEQVVAFTASLVKNLQKTSSPLKQNMKQAVQQVQINRDVGYWENSKSVEISAFNVPNNVGASLESNIIHAENSKIPKSFSSKIDIDVFGENVNVFEFGVRAEGLEKMAKRILGMDESTKQKKSLFTLLSKSASEEDKPEISFYTRTMGIEFFDMTVSDFPSFSRMMQFANIVNKLSHKGKADFAHSFIFLNTKFIIPSVTGRSYAFGITGSASVALSADGKFDVQNLLSSPHNCDIEGHLQPSANVEITTTLGIHSKQSQPDIKVVTSFHTEADVGTTLRIKDSHMAEARLDFPSEKLQLLKISTEVFEVDSNGKETPIIKDMQEKINHCFRSLEKPLGIQLCGKFETPRLSASKKFIYARGIGNIEFFISKTDPSMKGYSISLELPKQQSDHMSYRFIMDTPGSAIDRKFQASLDMRQLPSGEREFKLNAQCPFKDISTSGSYNWKPNNAQGSLNLIVDKSRRYSIKTVMEMSQSTSEISFKPTLQWTLPESDPVSVSGFIVYNNRRKQHIMIDFRSNKPGAKPYVLTGNLMKDGRMGLAKNNQWKLSADLVAKTPFLETKLHSTVDKQVGQSHGASSTFSVEYETQSSRKQSVKFSSKVQQNSDKVSASAQFEATQNPKYNWALRWNMQGSPKEALNNDITLGYGRNHEKTYIQISQTSRIGDRNSLSEGKIAVKAPQFSVDSELKLALGLQMQQTGNFHIESDLRYKEDRHVQLLMQLKQLSKSPVKMSVKAQLAYPGRKLMYKDEIKETSANTYQGHSILQWQTNQQASLQYTYKKLSDKSTFHYEIETTLNAPFMRSQITNQASVKASQDAMEIQAQVQSSRQSAYKLSAQLKRRGQSQMTISSPVAEGEIQISNEPEQKSSQVTLVLKQRNPQRYSASAALNLGSRKSVQAEASWNADRNPSQKISVAAEFQKSSQRSKRSFIASSQLQLLDLISASVSCSGEEGSPNTLQSKIEVSGRKFEKIVLDMQHEISQESIHSSIRCQQGQQEKAVLQLNGKYAKQSSGSEIQASVSVKSPDHSFEDKEFFIQQSSDRTRSSTNFQSTVHFENAPGKRHQVVAEYSIEDRSSKKLKLTIDTPYQQFRHQEINLSQRKEQNKQSLNAVVQYSRQEIAVSSVLSKTRQGRSITCSLKTPFNIAREASVHAAFEDQRSEKHAESHFELNGQRRFEASGNFFSDNERQSIQTNAKLNLNSELEIKAKLEKSKNFINHEAFLTKNSEKVMSYKMSHRASDEEFTCQLQAENGKNTLIDIKLTKEVRGPVKYSLKVNKPFAPVSVVIQSIKNDRNSHNLIINACKESSERQCYNVKGYYKKENRDENYNVYRKITLDIEKQVGKESVERLCNIHFSHSQQSHAVKSKLLLEAKQKKYGYEIAMKQRSDEEKPCEFDVSITIPSRTLRCSISAIHNAQHSVYEFTAIPNTSSPNSKFSIEIERNSRNNELSGQFRLNHPTLKTPVTAKYSLSKGQSQWPVSGQFELDYSQNQQDNIIVQFSTQSPRRQSEQRAFQLQLSTQSKEVDITLKTHTHQSSRKDIFTSEWTWKSRQGKQSGKLSIQLSNKKSGHPQTIQIQFAGPNLQYSIEGHTEWSASTLPSKVQLQISSQSHTIGQILFRHADSCTYFEIHSSAPLLKTNVCLNKKQQAKITVMSMELACQGKECLNIHVDLDPSRSHVANIGIQWQKEELRQLLKTMKEEMPTVKQQHYTEAKEELTHQIQMICSPFRQQIAKPLLAHLSEQAQQIAQEQAKEIKEAKKQLKELIQKLPKFPTCDEIAQQLDRIIEFLRKDAIRYVEQYAPEWVSDLLNTALHVAEQYFKEICRKGTFCYQVKQAYQRNGMQQVQRLLKTELRQRIEKIQQAKVQKIAKINHWAKQTWEKFIGSMDELKEKLSSIIPSDLVQKWVKSVEEVKEYFHQMTEKYLERLMELIDNFLDHAHKNEDFKVVSSLLQEAISELVETSQKMHLKLRLEPLKNTLMYKMPNSWLRENVNFSEFNMSSGSIQLQLRQPIDKSKIQLLKNLLNMAKSGERQ